MDLSKWDKILFGFMVLLALAGLIALTKRYYKLAAATLSILVDILDRVT